MIINDHMKADRYGKWARARKLVSKIQSTLSEDGYVVIATPLKAWQYDKRHVNMFKATRTGAYVQHGKKWDCIDYCSFRFARPVAAVETDLMQEYRDF